VDEGEWEGHFLSQNDQKSYENTNEVHFAEKKKEASIWRLLPLGDLYFEIRNFKNKYLVAYRKADNSYPTRTDINTHSQKRGATKWKFEPFNNGESYYMYIALDETVGDKHMGKYAVD